MGRNRNRNHGPPFVQIHHYLMDSKAWHELTPWARCAYLELARRYNGTNNGKIVMAVRTLAETMPCNKDTAARVLNDLELAGFITVNKIGSFSGNGVRQGTEYRLTSFRDDTTGELPTKSFDPGKKWIGASEASVRPHRTTGPTASDKHPQKTPFGPMASDRNATFGPTFGPTKPDTYRIYTIGDCAHGSAEAATTSPMQVLAKRAIQGAVASEHEDIPSKPSFSQPDGLKQIDSKKIVAPFSQRRASGGGSIWGSRKIARIPAEIRGDAMGTVVNILGRARNALTGMRPEVADNIIRQLTSRDPAVARRAQELIQKELAKQTRRKDVPRRVQAITNLGGLSRIPYFAPGYANQQLQHWH
jgi:hypothetical protein